MTKTELFKSLPVPVQGDIVTTLTHFTECHVTFEYGNYKAIPAIGIKATYAHDHKYIGCFKEKELPEYAKETIRQVRQTTREIDYNN